MVDITQSPIKTNIIRVYSISYYEIEIEDLFSLNNFSIQL